MGTSFTFLPIARDMVISSISDAKAEGLCDGPDCKGYGMEGYGRFLGTCMVAAFFEVGLAMLPPKFRKKMFPIVVVGVAVMLIGGSLIGAGIKYVGGGVFCAENNESKQAAIGFGPQLCNENGDRRAAVRLASTSARLLVIFMSVVLQLFGSPFLKSTFIFWGHVRLRDLGDRRNARAARQDALHGRAGQLLRGRLRDRGGWQVLHVLEQPENRRSRLPSPSCGRRPSRSASTSRTSCRSSSGTSSRRPRRSATSRCRARRP